jgi:hypothetical protein
MGSKCKTSHEIWTKLEESSSGSISLEVESKPKNLSSPSHHEELEVSSTSGFDDCSISSISPIYDMSQGNNMVSEEILCDDGSLVLCTSDSISINPNGIESLDLNTLCKKFFTHSCVNSPYISPRIYLIKFCDDILVSSCDHDQNDSISSSCCMTNHVEEIKENLGHMIKEEINRRTKKGDIKRRQCYECHEYGHLARACPTLDNEEPSSFDGHSSSPQIHMCLMASGSKVTPTLDPNTSPNDKSDDDDDNEAFLHEMEIMYASLRGNENAHAKVEHLMETLFEHKETINELNSLVNEGNRRFNLLKQELSEEKHTNSSLSQSIKSCELTNAKSINNACATNSTCNASILKKNVELRAQLELLTSSYNFFGRKPYKALRLPWRSPNLL